MSISSFFPCDQGHYSLYDKTSREGISDSEFLLEDPSLGERWILQSSFHLLFFKYLQLKIINIPKWHILGWHVLNLYGLALRWHIVVHFTPSIVSTSHRQRSLSGGSPEAISVGGNCLQRVPGRGRGRGPVRGSVTLSSLCHPSYHFPSFPS